jgi:hypothetical protein
VQAASTYEAVCRAWATFKASADTEKESSKTNEFIVEVFERPKTFTVHLDKLLAGLLRGRHGRMENPRKAWLRRLLDEDFGSHGQQSGQRKAKLDARVTEVDQTFRPAPWLISRLFHELL